MKIGMEEYAMGPHLHAKFGRDRGWRRVQLPTKDENVVLKVVFGGFPRLLSSPITMKFGMKEYTMGPHLRAKFGPDWGEWVGTWAFLLFIHYS